MYMWLKKNTLLLLLGLLVPHFYLAQSDFDKDQQLVFTLLNNNDFEKAKEIINLKFLKSDKDSRKIIGYAYLVGCYPDINDGGKKKDALEQAKLIATRTKRVIDQAYLDYGYAYYYNVLNNNNLFLKSIHTSINIFSRFPHENFVLAQLYMLNNYYKKVKLFEKNGLDSFKANQYALKSGNRIMIAGSYGNMGNYYADLLEKSKDKKYLDLSIKAYQNSYKYAELIDNPVSKKKALISYYINYGSLLQATQPDNTKEILNIYNKALELGENDIKYNNRIALIYGNLGSEYEKNNEFEKAKEYYLKAYRLSKTNKDIAVFNKSFILDQLSRIYEKTGDPEKALKYKEEASELTKKSFEEHLVNHNQESEDFYKEEQKKRQINELEHENKIYNKQRLLYLVMIVLGLICIVFLIYTLRYRMKLSKQKTDLLETEKHETELTLQLEIEERARLKAEQELLVMQQEQLKKQALAASLQLNKKTTFINELKDKVKDRKDFNIERILKDEQAVDHNFNDIQNIIQEVHPGFFKRLNETSKVKLTNQDMRYAAYIYLNMNNYQISSVLKADPKAVRMAKYRLKQKLGLGKEQDLYVFIQSLEL